ncbi:IraD/Gp25-like domain-containing protein [Bordetella sputigena]|uniref:type VI secretion system baseplate subunit TssE n=1 Tax=Bordetella sputigena TaxID=1416810 RepID=UPI0039EE68C2
MAELVSKNRLQPALLDRLTDMDPRSPSESRDRRVISLRQLREGVLRDVGYLLNARRLYDNNAQAHPRTASSVLNVGLSEFAGRVASDVDREAYAEEIALALRRFEPRIIADTLRVAPVATPDGMRGNMLAFLIEGDLWAQPYPERLYLMTELDLEDGKVAVSMRHQDRQP